MRYRGKQLISIQKLKTPIIRTVINHYSNRHIKPYNIGLLKLSKPLSFNQYVRPISLPRSGASVKSTGTVSGWGSISNTFQIILPNVLQTATFQLIDASTCRDIFWNQLQPQMAHAIHDTDLCSAPGRGSTCIVSILVECSMAYRVPNYSF